MNQSLAVTLGELQTEIYWLHDAEKFRELAIARSALPKAIAASHIYVKLGYSHEQAEAAGKLISEAYQLSDEADLAYKAGDSEKEKQFYHQVNDKLREAETILNYQNSIAIHQMQWWLYFRHKQKLQVVLHLFLQNFKAVGFSHLVIAIKLTYCLMEIGRVHKQRDKETTKHNAIKYWMELLISKPKQYPYLG